MSNSGPGDWGNGPKKRGAEQLASTEADCSAPLKDSGTMDLQACRPLLTTRVTTLYFRGWFQQGTPPPPQPRTPGEPGHPHLSTLPRTKADSRAVTNRVHLVTQNGRRAPGHPKWMLCTWSPKKAHVHLVTQPLSTQNISPHWAGGTFLPGTHLP